jgi:hydroxymethylpyrimidine pyrophosphatase-like HAD family hydrolase
MPMVASVLAFDFDGTLHDPAEEPAVPVEFFEMLLSLRHEHAMVWGINTGRSLAQMVEGFTESAFPFLPDWVVAREREIYLPAGFGRWLPLEEWNRTGERQIHDLFKRARSLMETIRHQVVEATGAQWIAMDGEPAAIIARTDEDMEWIVGKLHALASAEPLLSWQRNSIYLRFGHRDFQKGSSLSEVARHYSLGAPRCLAIGDSHNDLAMLDPRHAAMVGCPGNAVAEVQQHVAAIGGYVAQALHGAGVIETVRHFFPDRH